jgi:hypothetical protein
MESDGTIPNNLRSCQAALRKLMAEHAALQEELNELRKFVRYLTKGHASEKQISPSPNQTWLPFENDEEFQAARVEAEVS